MSGAEKHEYSGQQKDKTSRMYALLLNNLQNIFHSRNLQQYSL